MPANMILFEDFRWRDFLPLAYLRSLSQLVCGREDLLSRVRRLASNASQTSLWCRDEVQEVAAEATGLAANKPAQGPTLLLNARGFWRELPACDNEGAWVGVADGQEDIACICADAALASRLTASQLLHEDAAKQLRGLPRRDVSLQVKLMRWPWELVLGNKAALVADWRDCGGRDDAELPRNMPGVHVLDPANVRIGAGSRIKPCVVVDAEDGPVWIGENVTIYPHSYIQGPVAIGDGSIVQPGTVVRGGSTIGRRCKVGGEVDASIIHGFSNKQHDGFLGHSYIGEWVNIAADCINSDLKNTYGSIRVPINGREVDSGEMFVGMLCGDHSKAGINVSFPTGAVIGFCSSVFTSSSPKFVPSFTWVENGSTCPYDVDRGLSLARKVMLRRNRVMTAAEERAFVSVAAQAARMEQRDR
jgi:UDP-N-acetylglucosamine diphosphorylase/glucosamine-1-phosphate N-acetyltransferase